MRYIGAAVHKQYIFVGVLMPEGEVEQGVRLENVPMSSGYQQPPICQGLLRWRNGVILSSNKKRGSKR